ncbi:MAG: Dabb family protein [Bacteroidales bacterium]|nr:Dabb family protein [Bacteroidales bacterium]
MIEHVVLFRMHEVYKDELNGLKERLDALDAIDVVQRIETGLNFSERSDAYDLILKVYVKDKPALQQYVAHP